ncbi:MAG: nitroreductase family protein [Deltaproteobacteria bacterium]|nr:nitroreductase family protein [Deltaproteobacteria bacterium]
MDFKDVMYQRRAVNFFDPEQPVSEALLRELIETASNAPSSFNLQPWNLIVLKDAESKERLKKLAWNQPKVGEAPVVLIVLADRNGWKEGHAVVERNFQELVRAGAMTEDKREWFLGACGGLYGASEERQQAFACKNAGFFAMSLMLAAKNLGLDTHPMDGFDLEGVRNAFHIPDNFWIPLLLAVGYFNKDKELVLPKWRKSHADIVVSF